MMFYFNCNDVDSGELFSLLVNSKLLRRILCYHKITLQPIGGPLFFCWNLDIFLPVFHSRVHIYRFVSRQKTRIRARKVKVNVSTPHASRI